MGEKKYYLEYSTYQKCFHADTLDRIKEKNLRSVKEGRCNGYVIIAGPETYVEITKFKKSIEKEIR